MGNFAILGQNSDRNCSVQKSWRLIYFDLIWHEKLRPYLVMVLFHFLMTVEFAWHPRMSALIRLNDGSMSN